MNKAKSIKGILSIALISITIMYIIDGLMNNGYVLKSGVKIVMFLLLPIIYTLYDKNIKLKDCFKIKSKKSLIYSILLGSSVYVFILGSYFILKNFIDLSNIIENLRKNASIDKSNFLLIALYISFVNSLLEEFFFKGFIFLNLNIISGRKFAYIISAFLFSLYHIAIMGNWFSPAIFVLAMMGLFIGAFIFNYLNEKSGNIYNSWIVHMMANLSINTVGLMMFGII